jgi:hypothetical protein
LALLALIRSSSIEVVGSRAAHEDLPPPPSLLKAFVPERVVLEEQVAQESMASDSRASDLGVQVTLALFLSLVSPAASMLGLASDSSETGVPLLSPDVEGEHVEWRRLQDNA